MASNRSTSFDPGRLLFQVEQEETTRGAQWFSNPYADDAYFTDVVTEERGGSLFGRSGTINNAVPILRNDYNTREDEIFSIGLNTEYEINDRTRIVAGPVHSNNRRRETIWKPTQAMGWAWGRDAGDAEHRPHH
jgi:iron complex outermembrane recepter protein